MVDSFTGLQPIHWSKFHKRYMMHFIESNKNSHAFVLHILCFLFCFFRYDLGTELGWHSQNVAK